jgi:hypothetical protein
MKFKIKINEAIMSSTKQDKLDDKLRDYLDMPPVYKEKPSDRLCVLWLPSDKDEICRRLKITEVNDRLSKAFTDAKLKNFIRIPGDSNNMSEQLVWVRVQKNSQFTVYRARDIEKLEK